MREQEQRIRELERKLNKYKNAHTLHLVLNPTSQRDDVNL